MYVPHEGYLSKGIVIITTQNSWEYSNRHVEVINVPKINDEIAKKILERNN